MNASGRGSYILREEQTSHFIPFRIINQLMITEMKQTKFTESR